MNESQSTPKAFAVNCNEESNANVAELERNLKGGSAAPRTILIHAAPPPNLASSKELLDPAFALYFTQFARNQS